ncbi:hypothetical protein JG688_00014958 [Phytophthora aleatoria]|uniref:Uncharacterized protein n=1 Tax=Phytophthora aleatoria TaxID=2496075 RepID=A0A8J5IU93_9STRA|nr:hypothetical protein JG688_00014958 [Phytophthora aleatoria]
MHRDNGEWRIRGFNSSAQVQDKYCLITINILEYCSHQHYVVFLERTYTFIVSQTALGLVDPVCSARARSSLCVLPSGVAKRLPGIPPPRAPTLG